MDKKQQQEKLLKIWNDACRLKAELAALDNLPASRIQRTAIDSVQNGFRFWHYCSLGELLNLYEIDSEERDK
jgi:hypothetical protein